MICLLIIIFTLRNADSTRTLKGKLCFFDPFDCLIVTIEHVEISLQKVVCFRDIAENPERICSLMKNNL